MATVPLVSTKTPGIYRRDGKRGPTFVVAIDVGVRADGSRDQRKKSFKSYAAAKDYRLATLNALRAGSYVEPIATPLGAYADAWCAGLFLAGLRETTVIGYRVSLRNRFASLWDTPLSRLTAAKIEGAHAAELARGIKPSTVRLGHRTLKAMLDDAVRRGELVRNPARDAQPPPQPKRRPTVWTPDEANRFLSATAGDRWWPLWRTLLETGLRIGEALALSWDAVDLPCGAIEVRQTLTRTAANAQAIGDPKTPDARRRIDCSDDLVGVLRRLKAASGGAIVFPNLGGETEWRGQVNRVLAAACARAGVKRLSAHGLRHTSATLQIDAGIDVKTVAERLGHASVATLLDLYVHPSADTHKRAADRMGSVFAGARGDDVAILASDLKNAAD